MANKSYTCPQCAVSNGKVCSIHKPQPIKWGRGSKMPTNNWKPSRQRRPLWETDNVQFPRLLAEINAMGLTAPQYSMLESSMDLTTEQIDGLLERAEKRWTKIKNRTKLNP